MTTRVVADASALVALLLDSGPDGRWAAGVLAGTDLVAPALAAFETADVIRRHELAGLVSSEQAVLAHADLLDLAIEAWPYDLFAGRAWELRRNVTVYDAGYLALAELLGSSLVTLDRRLASVPGVRCRVLTP